VKISTGAGLKLVDYLLHTIPFLNRAPTWISLWRRILLPDVQDAGPHEAPHRRRRKTPVIYVADRDNMGKFNSKLGPDLSGDLGQLGGQVFSIAPISMARFTMAP